VDYSTTGNGRSELENDSGGLQWTVNRVHGIQKARGSNPLGSTKFPRSELASVLSSRTTRTATDTLFDTLSDTLIGSNQPSLWLARSADPGRSVGLPRLHQLPCLRELFDLVVVDAHLVHQGPRIDATDNETI